MDKITFVCKTDMSEKVQMIMRQTDYDQETAEQKLAEHHDDPIKVIKAYLGITEKKAPVKSVNQEIYRQLRYKLDSSVKEFNQKQYEKLEKEIEENKKWIFYRDANFEQLQILSRLPTTSGASI